MNVSESSRRNATARVASAPANRLNLQDIAAQLRSMLDDPDWRPACQDLPSLDALLHRVENEPEFGRQEPPPDVALLVAAHQDFCRFRRALAARLNAPDDQPVHITPDEWLQLRLRHGALSEALPPYARYRPEEDRFHIVD